MRRPGARLELQLTPLDVNLIGEVLLFLQLDVELARLMLGSDQTECAGDQRGEQHEIEPGHHRAGPSVLSAIRMTALRARGLAAISASVGFIALPMRRRPGCGRSRARTGRRRGSRSGFALSRRKRLTMRSSREWKLITTRRPPGARSSMHCGRTSDNSSSS